MTTKIRHFWGFLGFWGEGVKTPIFGVFGGFWGVGEF